MAGSEEKSREGEAGKKWEVKRRERATRSEKETQGRSEIIVVGPAGECVDCV